MAISFKKQNIEAELTDGLSNKCETSGEYAVNAIDDFESKDIVRIRKDEEPKLTLVPYHATRVLIYRRGVVDAEKPDPYGCTEGGGDGSTKACEAKACSGKVGC